MATTHAPQDSDVLASFLKEFYFSIGDLPKGPIGRLGEYGPIKRAGAAGLGSRHPAFDVMGKQIDAAASYVRQIEEFLNRPGTMCVPVHHDLGILHYDHARLTQSAFGHALRDEISLPHNSDRNTSYSVAIVRTKDKWRVVIYRWTIFWFERGDRGWRGKPSRKPWLESSYMDRVVTLQHLPVLFARLLGQVALMVCVASSNERALTQLSDVVKYLPPD